MFTKGFQWHGQKVKAIVRKGYLKTTYTNCYRAHKMKGIQRHGNVIKGTLHESTFTSYEKASKAKCRKRFSKVEYMKRYQWLSIINAFKSKVQDRFSKV